MARKSGKYSPELRAEVVAAVIEGKRGYAEVARDFGLVAETVRNWVIAEKKRNPGGSDDAVEAIDRARTAEMERRIRELEQENAFLKKSCGLLRARTTVSERYAFIAEEKANFEVSMMCRLSGVSRSGFYEWLGRPEPPGATRRREPTKRIRMVFTDSGRTYGYRRIHAELVRRGVRVDDELVRRLMSAADLVPVQVKRRRGLTVAARAAGPVPDLVGRDFTAARPGEKMVGDITRVDTDEGPLYLATVIDCFSKGVIGWAIDTQYPASLVCAALTMAAQRLPLPNGAVFHSDRGSQYTSHDFETTLRAHGIRQSVGRTGICFDNAMAESFFGKLKTEWTRHRTFTIRGEARHEIIKYIEGFYNRRRLHSGLDYRPPSEVLDEWFANRTAA